MRKLRHGEIKSLAQVTQLESSLNPEPQHFRTTAMKYTAAPYWKIQEEPPNPWWAISGHLCRAPKVPKKEGSWPMQVMKVVSRRNPARVIEKTRF